MSTEEKFIQLECMMTVIYKKLDDIESKMGGGSRSAPLSSYYNELIRDAQKLRDDLKKNAE